jgi:pimeloyl-ACP methyl ester carboxylesterase
MKKARVLAMTLGFGAMLLAGCGLAPRRAQAPAEPIGAPAAGLVSVELLEPYDAGRTPVLFVHGINGSPGDFEAELASLDKRRLQAWVARYPTDIRLGTAARGLEQALEGLRRRYGYTRLIIVAHSMGGLVARRALVEAHATGGESVAHVLVTLSSPWNGDEWAAVGARLSPRPAGSWIDLAPGSRFLLALRETMPGVPHYVFFGYRRGPSLLTSQSSDGSITLASQIPGWIQAQATQYWGYDADHTGILRDPAVLDRLSAVLAREAGR